MTSKPPLSDHSCLQYGTDNPLSRDISFLLFLDVISCSTDAAIICLHQRYGRPQEHSLDLKSIRSTTHFSENGRSNSIHIPRALSLTVGVLILHSLRAEQKLFKLFLPPLTCEASRSGEAAVPLKTCKAARPNCK